jgi:phenylalanyl-tRNA synthetase alpha subunit
VILQSGSFFKFCLEFKPLGTDDLYRSFEEMPTGTFVESGFWCFDALFVPQLHPARELQDTFYLSGMCSALTFVSNSHTDVL